MVLRGKGVEGFSGSQQNKRDAFEKKDLGMEYVLIWRIEDGLER